MAKETIVVVDDEAPARTAVARILKASGYVVHALSGGQEAIDFAMSQPFDVLLTDFRMPGGLDGLTTVRAVRRVNPQVVAIIMTGNNSIDLAIQSLNLGVHGFVVKPFTAYELLSTIERTIELQRLIRENIKMKALVDVFETTKMLITADSDPAQLPHLAAELAQSQTNSSEVVVLLHGEALRPTDPGKSQLEVVSVVVRNPEEAGSLAIAPEIYARNNNADLIRLRQVAERALEQGSTLFLIDDEEVDLDSSRMVPNQAHSCMVAVPMLAQGRRVGVLWIARLETEQTFSEVDLRTVAILAGQAAVAIDNTRLYRRLARVEALREADKLRSEFVSTVSHELRTPLTSIKGYATTLLRADVHWNEQVGRDYLSIISEECDKLMQLIDNILEVSKIEAGALRIFPEPVQIHEVAIRAVTEARRRRPDAIISLVFPPPETMPFVIADPQRIIQVLRNLLDNAMKYSPGIPTIGVRVSNPFEETNETLTAEEYDSALPRRVVQLSVEDNGLGLKQEDQARIFERFFRVDTGSARRSEGTGLGLAICHGIVEAHHGRIWVESAGLGKGCIFHFTLPVVEGVPQVELD
ncbi:MAG: response regulator [Chloroflexi bacterium]|nr:response regulator [Chloroflexota bacterium]